MYDEDQYVNRGISLEKLCFRALLLISPVKLDIANKKATLNKLIDY
jgi:hypothetical protein